MRGFRKLCIQVRILLPKRDVTLTEEGLVTSPSYELSRKYLKRGCGGVLAFKLKATTGLSEPISTRFKLVSRAGK